VQVTDSTGAVLSHYAYDPWGRQAVLAGSGHVTDGYAGYEAIAENLLLTQYRTYGVELGRWTSEDPASFVDGPNLYAYVDSRPTVLFDPFGLSASGKTIECGPCMIRVDNDPHKGRHAHWWCNNGSTGCVKPDGSGCEGSGPPPNRVRECLRNHRFFVEPKPILSCDQNCQNVLLLAGAVAASAILTCVFKYPILVPAFR
jgi:RHS repeat-associated protein